MIDELRADYEALQKENAALKEINESLHSSSKFTYENQKTEIESLRKQVEEIKELCAKEAEHWKKIGKNPEHKCGEYIASAIRGIKPASKNGE